MRCSNPSSMVWFDSRIEWGSGRVGEWEKIVERKVSAKCVVRKIRAEGVGRRAKGEGGVHLSHQLLLSHGYYALPESPL